MSDMRWFQRAAEAGHAPSMVNLGLCLTHPEPSLDAVAAIRWFRKAAENGYAGGMVWLGFSYREGTGVPRDDKEAVQWFIKAVEAGDSYSMIHVGRMFARQLSAPVEAVSWFLRAAEAGLSESFLELARLYENSELQVHDPVEAHKWFRVAVEYTEGHSTSALFAIARQYLQGVGAPCDLQLAKWWLQRILLVASANSPSRKEATKLLKKLDGQLL
jgi:TPR repeat protein